MELEEKYYQLNGIQLHVMEAGNPEGEILLFLHGFPEFWWAWRKQIDFFAAQGYRVVVPDQRGYNLSTKPKRIKAYKREHLVADVVALIGQLPAKQVNLLGHDWGGAIAWATALLHPQLIRKLIVLNLPHPQVMKHFLKKSLQQMRRSSYMLFFQIPYLPEKILSAFNFKLLEITMQQSSRRGTFSAAEMQRYKEAWRQPGALTAMLNWYRAALGGTLSLHQQASMPTLLIWGKQDQFLSYKMAAPSMKRCVRGRLEMINDATHWVQHEKAALVNKLVLEFIKDQA